MTDRSSTRTRWWPRTRDVGVSGAPGATVTRSLITGPGRDLSPKTTRPYATPRSTHRRLGFTVALKPEHRRRSARPRRPQRQRSAGATRRPRSGSTSSRTAPARPPGYSPTRSSAARLHALGRAGLQHRQPRPHHRLRRLSGGQLRRDRPRHDHRDRPRPHHRPGFRQCRGGGPAHRPRLAADRRRHPRARSAGEPTTDPDGHPRILDGNGDCTANRDIGAYEYVAPLKVTASGPRPRRTAGQAVSFHAAGCGIDPRRLAPTYTWSFDDGATGGGCTTSPIRSPIPRAPPTPSWWSPTPTVTPGRPPPSSTVTSATTTTTSPPPPDTSHEPRPRPRTHAPPVQAHTPAILGHLTVAPRHGSAITSTPPRPQDPPRGRDLLQRHPFRPPPPSPSPGSAARHPQGPAAASHGPTSPPQTRRPSLHPHPHARRAHRPRPNRHRTPWGSADASAGVCSPSGRYRLMLTARLHGPPAGRPVSTSFTISR